MPRPQSAVPVPPNLSTVWEADLAPVAVAFDDDPSARPALLLVTASGFVVVFDLVARPGALPSDVADIIARGVREAMAATTSMPTTVRVRDRDVATALRSLLENTPIAVRTVAKLPGVDAALDGFDRMVVGSDPRDGPRPRVARPETWAGWGLPMDQIGRLFVAAAAYYRAAPWVNMANEDVLRSSVAGGGTWSLSVMGMAGELFGLAMYARHKDLQRLLSGSGDDPGTAMAAIRGTVVSFSYDHRDDLAPGMRREIRDNKWGVAGPMAYPCVYTMNAPGGGLSPRVLEDLVALLLAIPRFAHEYEPVLAGREAARYPIRWRDAELGVSIDFHGALIA